jgi:hypothetical protein
MRLSGERVKGLAKNNVPKKKRRGGGKAAPSSLFFGIFKTCRSRKSNRWVVPEAVPEVMPEVVPEMSGLGAIAST